VFISINLSHLRLAGAMLHPFWSTYNKAYGELHTTVEGLQRKIQWLYVEISQVVLSLN
jgi:hypothetical protein